MPRPLTVHFAGAAGNRLAAILDLPDAGPRAFVLYAHCFTCTKDLKAAYWIGQALAASGVALLRFDFAGLGGSEGDFSATNLSTNVQDLLAAAGYLEREHAPARLVIGHSLGGLAALAAAPQLPSVRAVVTIGTPHEPDHLRRHATTAASGHLELAIGGRRVGLRGQLLDDLAGHDPGAIVGGLGRPLLILHAPADAVVGVEQAGRLFQAARHPKSFVARDGADHLLSRRQDAERVAALLLAWSAPYL